MKSYQLVAKKRFLLENYFLCTSGHFQQIRPCSNSQMNQVCCNKLHVDFDKRKALCTRQYLWNIWKHCLRRKKECSVFHWNSKVEKVFFWNFKKVFNEKHFLKQGLPMKHQKDPAKNTFWKKYFQQKTLFISNEKLFFSKDFQRKRNSTSNKQLLVPTKNIEFQRKRTWKKFKRKSFHEKSSLLELEIVFWSFNFQSLYSKLSCTVIANHFKSFFAATLKAS